VESTLSEEGVLEADTDHFSVWTITEVEEVIVPEETLDEPEPEETVDNQIPIPAVSIAIGLFAARADMIGQVTGTIEAVLGGIAVISLVVAGVGIINTMTVSVSERTKEIGILKAIGAKNMDVLWIFLAESGYTGLAGGFLGGALGYLLGFTIGNFIGLPIFLDFGLWSMVVLFAIITSVLAGSMPAWSAANLHPVEALRHE
jgi:ABC-type antimicrobial peptide transport system permease subunit